MIISKEDGVKFLRSNLEAELEQLSQMESNDEVNKATGDLKRLLALSDDELAKEFESKRRNNEKKELSEDDLDEVAGGVIVDRGGPYDYWVIDEKTGQIIDNEHATKRTAEEIANHAGVSTEMISMDECKKRFGMIADPKDPNYVRPGDFNYWWDNFRIIK